ncbi:MarR family transcriptional regulator [Geomonas limicola]|uniref:MarR family transcriptional regulator n=1 Tax=Geomonas limicola TaxID=2740186 RepID=A0A6V8N8L0_9BACT|nr:MarR family winged helix-turn-helix transcriptional regulator [Geomonas limicola]GFO68908.1 MarR family transcriptional regulator [Geomonas limicola]
MKTPNPNPSVCSCVNLRRASRAITRIYDKALEPVDLKITQYSVLANVARSGPLSSSNLARILRLDRTTLVRNLKSLQAAGFIEDHPEAGDPRERAIRITEAGHLMVDKARPLWGLAQRQIEDHLGSAALNQLTTLVTSLETLSDHLVLNHLEESP